MSGEAGEEVAVKDPLAIASGAFIVGAFLGPPSRLWLAIALAVVLSAFVAATYAKKRRVPFLALAVGAAQAGMLAVAVHLHDPQPLYDRAEAAGGRTVIIEGTIAEVPDRSAYGRTLIVELAGMSMPSTSSTATVSMVRIEPIAGRVKVTVADLGPEDDVRREREGRGVGGDLVRAGGGVRGQGSLDAGDLVRAGRDGREILPEAFDYGDQLRAGRDGPEILPEALDYGDQLRAGRDGREILPAVLDYGDRIRAAVRFSEPEAHLIPAFRARGLAVRRGVAITGGAASSEVAIAGQDGEEPRRAGEEPERRRADDRTDAARRSYLDAAWRDQLAENAGDPTLAAIALSDRSRAEPALERKLTHHGLSFVFALGGAAMAALAFAVYLAAARASKRPRLAAIAALPIAFALTVAHGWTPSALRVGATLAILFLWNAIRDRHETRRALPASIIVVLAADPAALGDTFYQLAVASITAVVTVYPAFREHLRHRALQPLLLLATLAFATAPLITRQFDRITVLSLAANMINLPLATLFVAPFGLLGGVFDQPWLASIAELARSGLIEVPVARAMATPTVLECALFYTAVFSFAVRPSTRTSTGTAVLAVIALAVAGAGSRLDRHPQIGILPGGFVVVEDENKGVLVYGTGERTADPEAGTRILDQYLKKRRITELAVLVLPAAGLQEEAVKRQHEVGEVRYAADVLEEVRARLGPAIAIEPGFSVQDGERRYFSWRDGLITVREKDGARRVEAYLQR